MKQTWVIGCVVLVLMGCTIGQDLGEIESRTATKNETLLGVEAKTAEAEPQAKQALTGMNAPTQSTKPPVAEAAKVDTEAGKIVVREYFDFGCGYCKRLGEVLTEIVNERDDVEVVARHFVVHPQYTAVHRASICAGDQGQFANFHDTYFAQYFGRTDQGTIEKIIASLSLDTEMYNACMASDLPDTTIAQHTYEAQLLGARGTPFMIVNNDVRLPGAKTKAEIEAVLDTL